LGKAVAALPEVRRAMQKGRIIVANGTTTAFVAEELLGQEVPKFRFAAGYISRGRLDSTGEAERIPAFVLVNGQPVTVEVAEAIREFEAGDVFIKGANAVDPNGHVGILLGNDRGGTIGMALGTLTARGCTLIVPVGLEKLVPSVIEAARTCGITRLKYAMGGKVGLMPVVNATVITEIEALHVLTGVEATHVSSGGIGGSEGAVVLVVEGTDAQVSSAFELVQHIQGEPPIQVD